MENKQYSVIRADGKDKRFNHNRILVSNLSRRMAWKIAVDFLEIGMPTEVIPSPPKKKS